MSVECCGVRRTTNFCPQCGERLNADPLGEILEYFVGRLKVAKHQLSNIENGNSVTSNAGPKRELIKTYDRWILAIQQAIRDKEAYRP